MGIGQVGKEQKLISHITVTLNEGKGHSNCYQNVKFSGLYYHTEFEINHSVNV